MVSSNILIMILYPEFNKGLKINDIMNRVNIMNPSTNILEPYFKNKYEVLQFNNIVTDDNTCDNRDDVVFEIINNKIYKVNNSTKYEQYHFSNEISFRLQDNEYNERKEVFFIPLNNQCVKSEIRKYKLTPKSLLTLNVEHFNGLDNITSHNTNHNSNKKIYFETTENEITESIKEDLITFLSLLKLYK